MTKQQQADYNRIAQAISYIEANFKSQPSLEKIAKKIGLSPFHFQRLFTNWAGTSPKKFLQYISVEYAKSLLRGKQISVLQTSVKTGLSSTGRLHDLFVSIEGMTPGEYKNGGANLTINYSFAPSRFGNILIASTNKGVCCIAFSEDQRTAFADLQRRFTNALFIKKTDSFQRQALNVFTGKKAQRGEIKLHLKGTDFQLKVWEALLKIPAGGISTYGRIAQSIKQPTASRAVGTAVGSNPVSFLIPCHRVIQSSGVLGNYHWGSSRKAAMLGWEFAQTDNLD